MPILCSSHYSLKRLSWKKSLIPKLSEKWCATPLETPYQWFLRHLLLRLSEPSQQHGRATRGWQRIQPPSTVAVGWGLDCLLANGSLSRAAAMPHSAVEEMSQEPLIGNLQWCCTQFSESFGIKDFFREGPISRSRWLQKVVVCAPNAYWPNATSWTSRQEEMVWTAQAGKPLASLAEQSGSDGTDRQQKSVHRPPKR